MKLKSLFLWSLMIIGAVSCKYDDGELWNKVNDLDDRLTNIESKLTQMNTDITSMGSIVNALEGNVYVTSVTETENGYTIKFSDGKTASITNGADGAAGKDAPVIGFDKDTDGKYYWTQTIDGQQNWLTDGSGNKIPVTGEDAVTPQLKVSTTGYWMISYDNGLTFAEVLDENGNPVKAVGEDGQDGSDGTSGTNGDSWFDDVQYNSTTGTLTIVINGESFTIEVNPSLSADDNPLADNYFQTDGSIEAVYHAGNIPEAEEANEEAITVPSNTSFIPGGSSYISFQTAEELDRICVGVEGEEGYYEWDAENCLVPAENSRAIYSFSYQFTLLFQEILITNVPLRFVVHTITGRWYYFICIIEYIPVGIGDLQVSLAFSNAKDIDLWVKEPNGNLIYYGDRNPYIYKLQGSESPEGNIIGLDLDSNAGCGIDNVNKENIYFPADCIQKGTYEVWVDMWSNCDPSIATDWTVRVNYKGMMIVPDRNYGMGVNPASGTFPINTPSNHSNIDNMVKVMSFTINEGIEVPAARTGNSLNIEDNLTETARMKLFEMGYDVW